LLDYRRFVETKSQKQNINQLIMQNNFIPIPDNESERLISLSNMDFDYTNHEENFKDLTLLAAKTAGTEISLINIIDSFTQWSISSHGINLKQSPREESICQYTIMTDHPLEVPDLTKDERFNYWDLVKGPSSLRYYYGLPLQISKGINIGSLCVIDEQVKTLTPEKIELLKIIAESIVKRLKSFRYLALLQSRLKDCNESKKKVAHDIRGPLVGIIGLTQILSEEDIATDPQQLSEIINMINNSSTTLLDLADEILSDRNKQTLNEDQFDLSKFKDKLERLYAPQARHKNVNLDVLIDSANAGIPFSKNKLLQIAGNLISNAIKFTPELGKIQVYLSLVISKQEKVLKILVTDTGVGIDSATIDNIVVGKGKTSLGTMDEKGYGFGLNLVAHLVESLNGKMSVSSRPSQGARFEVVLPQNL
jgi:signal transduction histidine kinase